jgi:HAD superfamily hydrolase (TIGR01509 family)
MLNPKAILFDMDGTLIDTERLGAASWDHAANDVGVSVTETLKREMIGRNMPDIRSMVRAAIAGPRADALLERAEHHYHRLVSEAPPPIKAGAPELLDWLLSHNIPMALATSSRAHQAEDKLGRCGLRAYFSVVIGGDQICRGKPDPEIFLRAAEGLGVLAEECVAFEDSGPGIESAHRAGACAILVPEYWPADPGHALFAHHILRSLHEALPLLDSMFHTSPSLIP